jgi:hypothetical protein
MNQIDNSLIDEELMTNWACQVHHKEVQLCTEDTWGRACHWFHPSPCACMKIVRQADSQAPFCVTNLCKLWTEFDTIFSNNLLLVNVVPWVSCLLFWTSLISRRFLYLSTFLRSILLWVNLNVCIGFFHDYNKAGLGWFQWWPTVTVFHSMRMLTLITSRYRKCNSSLQHLERNSGRLLIGLFASVVSEDAGAEAVNSHHPAESQNWHECTTVLRHQTSKRSCNKVFFLCVCVRLVSWDKGFVWECSTLCI